MNFVMPDHCNTKGIHNSRPDPVSREVYVARHGSHGGLEAEPMGGARSSALDAEQRPAIASTDGVTH